MKKNILKSVCIGSVFVFSIFSCSKDGSNSGGGSGTSYDFSAAGSAQIQAAAPFISELINKSSSIIPRSSTGPTLCSSVICFTPTAISGKYYGLGLSIQSNGSGMMAYFG